MAQKILHNYNKFVSKLLKGDLLFCVAMSADILHIKMCWSGSIFFLIIVRSSCTRFLSFT